MGRSLPAADARAGFPRYFRIGTHRVSAYKIFLCIGIYAGTLISAAVAQRSGISPLRMGIGCVSCAIVGMAGARIFHLIVFARHYAGGRFWNEAWNPANGGWSAFGGLVIVPFSFVLAGWLGIPVAVYWDHMICGIVAFAICGRLGCIFNGCCGGQPTAEWYGVCQHDTHGMRRRRIPVQWLEIVWWLLAGAGLVWFWRYAWPPGSYALAVLCWYGLGRVWLEPLRERPDVVGRVRVNQVVAALLALVTGGMLLMLS